MEKNGKKWPTWTKFFSDSFFPNFPFLILFFVQVQGWLHSPPQDGQVCMQQVWCIAPHMHAGRVKVATPSEVKVSRRACNVSQVLGQPAQIS
jgi:hypothetical protein